MLLPSLLALVPLLAASPQDAPPEASAATTLAGWVRTVGSPDAQDAVVRVPAAAFVLGAGEGLDPRRAPGDGAVSFEAMLRCQLGGRYRFGLEAAGGTATLQVRDAAGAVLARAAGEGAASPALSDWVAIPRGAVRVDVVFTRAGAGPARLRTMWERENTADGGFPLEPIPSRAVHVPAERAKAIEHEEVFFAGRVQLEERGCTSCHAPTGAAAAVVGVRRAPSLASAGERLGLDWMRAWIRDPAAVLPRAAMPALLGVADDPDHEALALASFLASQGDAAVRSDPGAWGAADEAPVLARGQRLYHTLGCVACHGALDSPEAVFQDGLHAEHVANITLFPLDALRGKWRPGALSAFLRDPQATRPDGRMPSFGLSEEEADALACYLVSRFGAGTPSAAPEPALVDEGRALFTRRGCSACHALEGVPRPPAAPALTALDPRHGCLDPQDRATPRFVFEGLERGELAAGIATAAHASGARLPLDEARRTVAALRCDACHRIDGDGGVPVALDAFFVSTSEQVDLGDEGRLPPDLSGVGSKLTSAWLRRVLGEGARARPYLAARMPRFGERAQALVQGLAQSVGVLPDHDAPEPQASDELVLTGRALLAHENLGCMSCHVYKDYPPTGTPGPDITLFGERLRYEWFRVYMENPQRYKPGGRMPDFATGGKSSLRTVYDGDMARQADAMWAYFGLGERMPPPEGVEPGSGLPLSVQGRPIVMRAFLKDVGSRGIAVGLPVGVHFAFDAATCRLAYAWQGDFLDASGSWAGRGGNELGGQGPVVWHAPDGPEMPPDEVIGRSVAQPPALPDGSVRDFRFRGYRLEPDGHPVFLYDWAGTDPPVHVRERCDARVAPELVLVRAFRVEGLAAGEGFRFDAGPNCRVTRAVGCHVEPSGSEGPGGGSGWLDVRQDAGSRGLAFEVEVRP